MTDLLKSILVYLISLFTLTIGFGQSPINEELVKSGMKYLGKPYRSGTIESLDFEKCIVQNEAFDCYTFVERALAAALDPKHPEDKILQLRYRNGKVEGYCSRLHYLSDWLLIQIKNNVLQDVSASIPGSSEIYFHLNFMSKHPHLYPAMLRDKCQNEIKSIEAQISKKKFYFIPKSSIDLVLPYIQNGDLIAIATYKKGLDFSHVGIAVIKNGVLYLLHASSDQKKVTLSKRSLQDYLKRNRLQKGIAIFRVVP